MYISNTYCHRPMYNNYAFCFLPSCPYCFYKLPKCNLFCYLQASSQLRVSILWDIGPYILWLINKPGGLLLAINQSHSPVDPSPPVLSMRLGRPHQHRHCRKRGRESSVSNFTSHYTTTLTWATQSALHMTYTHIMDITWHLSYWMPPHMVAPSL